MTPTFKTVALQYVQLAKELDKSYEHQIFELWRKENTEKAINLLKNHILDRKTVGGQIVYSV